MKKIIKGYKGYDKNLQCRGFQYEIYSEKKHGGDFKLCDSGFHFCENPMNVLSFYSPSDGNRFTEVEALGEVKNDEIKSVTDHIKIGAELDLSAMVKAAVSFIYEKASVKKIFKKCNATSGSYAHSATSGERAHSATSGNDANSATSGYGAHSATSGNDAHSATSGNDANSATSGSYAHSATSGERANSATSGYGAHSATSGNDAIAVSVGRKAKAKANLGCFIVLAEWKEGKEFTDAKPIGVISAKVDGEKIKADTWYKVVGGKLVITDDSNE
jgi:hypothetical protein